MIIIVGWIFGLCNDVGGDLLVNFFGVNCYVEFWYFNNSGLVWLVSLVISFVVIEVDWQVCILVDVQMGVVMLINIGGMGDVIMVLLFVELVVIGFLVSLLCQVNFIVLGINVGILMLNIDGQGLVVVYKQNNVVVLVGYWEIGVIYSVVKFGV